VSNSPLTLTIETSCDETAVAISRGTEILSNVVYSQLELHAQYGGVVPGIAKLAHQQKIDEVINTALNRAEVSLEQIETLAVTVGPGLAIALEVGVNKAKELAKQLNIPLIAVNHMEGHLLSSFANQDFAQAQLPALGLLVSGGHTEFILIEKLGKYEKVGETLDDACGEAFDKCAHLLGLPYPGGPAIARLADVAMPNLTINYKQQHQSYLLIATSNLTKQTYTLTIPMAGNPSLDVSYSGLKTAMKQLIAGLAGVDQKLNIQETGANAALPIEFTAELAAVFQVAAFRMLELKLQKALQKYPSIKELWLGGGVIANSYFRSLVTQFAHQNQLILRLPAKELTTDNAAMIAIAAYRQWLDGNYLTPNQHDQLDRQPNLTL
jgi:N6-L-threonylcarbamoyladenine synthase